MSYLDSVIALIWAKLVDILDDAGNSGQFVWLLRASNASSPAVLHNRAAANLAFFVWRSGGVHQPDVFIWRDLLRLEVQHPPAVIPFEHNFAPAEWNLGIRVERADVGPC